MRRKSCVHIGECEHRGIQIIKKGRFYCPYIHPGKDCSLTVREERRG